MGLDSQLAQEGAEHQLVDLVVLGRQHAQGFTQILSPGGVVGLVRGKNGV